VAFVIAYIDSSVVLRVILRAPEQLQQWPEIVTGYSNELLEVEVRRSLDRLWLRNKLTDASLAAKSAEAAQIFLRTEFKDLTRDVLRRAMAPLPTPLGTLDSLHLTTALMIRESQPRDQSPLVFATHDRELATAARAVNFEVIGA
jgi:predicted nucleic acid-binding protein